MLISTGGRLLLGDGGLLIIVALVARSHPGVHSVGDGSVGILLERLRVELLRTSSMTVTSSSGSSTVLSRCVLDAVLTKFMTDEHSEGAGEKAGTGFHSIK